MNRRSWAIAAALSVAWLGWVSAGCHALTLTGALQPAPAVADAVWPTDPAYMCRTTAYDAAVLSAGRSLHFETAWNTVLPREWDPTGWVLSWAADPLDAVLDITTYEAFNYGPDYGSSYAGAEIRIHWTPTPQQQDLKWIQALHTNLSRHPGTQWCLDVYTFTKDKPPLYPYQYDDFRFYDKPERWCVPGEHVFWDAYLYLASVDRVNKSAVVYEGLYWGFAIDYLVIPEPASLTILAAGIGLILASAIRRRHS